MPGDPTLDGGLQEAYASASPDKILIDTISIYYDGLVDGEDNPAELYLFNGENSTTVSEAGGPTPRSTAGSPSSPSATGLIPLTAIAPKTSARCNSAELHWAAGLVGKPYRSGARGPDAFDCWGIVQFGWQQRLGFDVPDVRSRTAAMFRSVMRGGHVAVDDVEAVEVDAPAELDAVYMTSRQHPHHVGLWIAPDALGGG